MPAFAVVAMAAAAILSTPACQRSGGRNAAAPDSATTARSDSLAARGVVLAFGGRLKQVSLMAPDSARERAMQTQYGGLVSPTLIRKWADDPRHAAGRLTSSPWPDRIEIAAMSRKSSRVFLVDGEIIERTSSDAAAAARIPVRIAIWKTGPKWLIMNYDQGAPQPAGATADIPSEDDPESSPERAAAVIRAYYDALNAKKLPEAYRMWEADGAASGQSLMQFLNGHGQTKSIEVSIGAPGPMGAAAGSRYVEVPVRIVTVGQQGERQSLEGTYTLRRSVVDGATAAQRTWHIYSAKLSKPHAV
jgi:hypothetical protein